MVRSLLLSCEGIGKAYGTRSLFDGLTLGLFEGDQAGPRSDAGLLVRLVRPEPSALIT